MFSYRHAFHAGNHADVLKHAVLVHLLDHLNLKETPYTVVDTHAGAGLYDLGGEWAQKKAEYAEGVALLHEATRKDSESPLPALVTRYLQAVAECNPPGELKYYPGSPWLVLQALRDSDKLRLYEMHPAEFEILRRVLSDRVRERPRQIQIKQSNGFDGIRAQLPPASRRGLIIIDPSYEDKHDYGRVVQSLGEGIQRFATGCYAVWYPLVQRREVQQLIRSLEKLPVSWLNASLTVCRPARDGHGLHGSGMFVINPPWTLKASLEEALPWLVQTLGRDERAQHTLSVAPAEKTQTKRSLSRK